MLKVLIPVSQPNLTPVSPGSSSNPMIKTDCMHSVKCAEAMWNNKSGWHSVHYLHFYLIHKFMMDSSIFFSMKDTNLHFFLHKWLHNHSSLSTCIPTDRLTCQSKWPWCAVFNSWLTWKKEKKRTFRHVKGLQLDVFPIGHSVLLPWIPALLSQKPEIIFKSLVKQRKAYRFLLVSKPFSWETNLWVMLGDFTV